MKPSLKLQGVGKSTCINLLSSCHHVTNLLTLGREDALIQPSGFQKGLQWGREGKLSLTLGGGWGEMDQIYVLYLLFPHLSR